MDTLDSATKESRRRARNPLANWFSILILFGVVAFVIWRIFIAIEIRGRFSRLAAAHLPANGAELDKWYREVPPGQNGALVLTNVFEMIKKLPDEQSQRRVVGLKPLHNHPLSEEEVKFAYQYVELNEPALHATADALPRFSRSRYPINLSAGAMTLLPHLANLKLLALLADLKARQAVESGDVSTAIGSWNVIFGLAKTLDTEPTLISQLVRIIIVRIGVRSLEFGVSKQALSGTQIDAILKSIAEVKRTNQMAFALIGERAITIQAFRQNIFEKWSVDDADGKPVEQKASGLQRGALFATGFFERDLGFFLKTMEAALPICQKPPPESFAAERLFLKSADTAKRRGCILSAMVLPAYSRLLRKEAESLAELDLSQCVLSIERYRIANGRLPHNADEVKAACHIPTDPFSQSPLRYKTLSKGFVVYSVGPNGVDDDAKEKPVNGRGDDWDITFFDER